MTAGAGAAARGCGFAVRPSGGAGSSTCSVICSSGAGVGFGDSDSSCDLLRPKARAATDARHTSAYVQSGVSSVKAFISLESSPWKPIASSRVIASAHADFLS